MDVSSNDFALYDEDGKKVSSEHVYDSNDNFKVMSNESLSEDKSFTEPLVFEVKKMQNMIYIMKLCTILKTRRMKASS